MGGFGRPAHWLIWLTATLMVGAAFAGAMAYGGDLRKFLLIGRTTDAHHQIEMACTACHTDAFGGREAIEEACLGCHADGLKEMDDSHPQKKFRDPRNADRLEVLDAMKCLTCHVEHRPEVTGPIAVTLPIDYCSACHQDIGAERASHKGLSFETCANAGCHNFHDNRALYEDFLEKHMDQPDLLETTRLSFVNWQGPAVAVKPPAPAGAPDAPSSIQADAHVMNDWLGSAHAAGGVNCSGCHQPSGARASDASTWIEKPGMDQCGTCHASEAGSFTQGRHGMRLAADMWMGEDAPLGLVKQQKLSPMNAALARLPMKRAAVVEHRELTCTTCHVAHAFNTAKASVQACASCHNDEHTRAYFASPHYARLKAERAGKLPAGSGLSCANCHMPRFEGRDADGVKRLMVNHNQSANLRPNEVMARQVCMDCHGLGFALDSLADERLIERNFKGRPQIHVESIDWVKRRVRQREGDS